VFLGSKNLIFVLIWTQSSQNIDLYHFGKIFKIRIQKKYQQKMQKIPPLKKKYAPTNSTLVLPTGSMLSCSPPCLLLSSMGDADLGGQFG
jgi:hypothetical protein